MSYGITQCYLPPCSGENPAFTPAEAGTRFSDPGGMQGWVDLCYVKADRLAIEPATCKSQVKRPTAEPPPRNTLQVASLAFLIAFQSVDYANIFLSNICSVKCLADCQFGWERGNWWAILMLVGQLWMWTHIYQFKIFPRCRHMGLSKQSLVVN